MNRRQFLARTVPATVSLGLLPPAISAGEPAAVPDEERLAQARQRIRECRQGPVTVMVRRRNGRPVPGARVCVEQTRHAFLFGCNFFRFGRLEEPAWEEAYRERFAAVFNYATLGFYWPYFEARRGQPIYDYVDRVAAWCRDRRIHCKGHPLVWDFADPRWLPRDFAEIRDLSHARVREIVSRYRGRIDRWDVVNEPTHLGRFNTRLGEWAIATGAVPYVVEHLRIAREAHPAATLLVNDYRTDPPFYRILDQLREGGQLLFDAVGIQSHMHGERWPLQTIWEVCDRYAPLGRPLHFTETTVVSSPRLQGERWQPATPEREAAQADYTARFYTMLFGHPAVQALTWWDFSDNGAWQSAPAGWVRRDMSPKPVYERLRDLIMNQWWTCADGVTDAQGEFAARAFFGDHRLAVRLPAGAEVVRETTWLPGGPGRYEVVVD